MIPANTDGHVINVRRHSDFEYDFNEWQYDYILMSSGESSQQDMLQLHLEQLGLTLIATVAYIQSYLLMAVTRHSMVKDQFIVLLHYSVYHVVYANMLLV